MSTFGAGSTGTYIAAGVVAAGVAVGGYVYVTSKDEPVVAPETPVVAEAVVDAVTEAVTEPAPVVTAEPAPELAPVVEAAPEVVVEQPEPVAPAETVEIEPTAPVPPTFDVVRVDADGNAVIAGLAAPKAEVFVYLGNDEIANTGADNSGNFVALATIEPSDAPQVVSLVMRIDGVDTPSDARVIIAPRPVAVAEAVAPEPTEPPVETPAAAVQPVEPAVVAVEPPAEVAEIEAAVEETEIAEPAPVVVEAPVVVAEPAPEIAPAPTPAPVAAPTVLIADSDGVRILQGSEEVTPSEITIDAISYGDNGDAILTGRGDADAVARVYLNNAITGETPIDATGDWTLALADVAAGIYTLRVDQVDGNGGVTSRFETPFKREDPVVIAAVAAPEPVSESVKEPVATAPVVETPEEAVTETASPVAPAPRVTAVTVQPGFTLWKIAKDAYGQGDLYVQVFDANKDAIVNPDLIYPGQVFEVPSVSGE